jgi:hypothetical protein
VVKSSINEALAVLALQADNFGVRGEIWEHRNNAKILSTTAHPDRRLQVPGTA